MDFDLLGQNLRSDRAQCAIREIIQKRIGELNRKLKKTGDSWIDPVR